MRLNMYFEVTRELSNIHLTKHTVLVWIFWNLVMRSVFFTNCQQNLSWWDQTPCTNFFLRELLRMVYNYIPWDVNFCKLNRIFLLLLNISLQFNLKSPKYMRTFYKVHAHQIKRCFLQTLLKLKLRMLIQQHDAHWSFPDDWHSH